MKRNTLFLEMSSDKPLILWESYKHGKTSMVKVVKVYYETLNVKPGIEFSFRGSVEKFLFKGGVDCKLLGPKEDYPEYFL